VKTKNNVEVENATGEDLQVAEEEPMESSSNT